MYSYLQYSIVHHQSKYHCMNVLIKLVVMLIAMVFGDDHNKA